MKAWAIHNPSPEPEVVAELKLTADQRDRIRTIEEDALFGWMRRPPPGDSAGAPPARQRPAQERALAVFDRGCPVAQTLKGCVEISHAWEISEE